MLSPKAKAAADKIKSFDEGDVKSISEMIKHEVEHATDALSKRAKLAEERLKQFTDYAGDEISHARRKAEETVEAYPIPSAAIALGVGLVLGLVLASSARRH